MLPPWAAAVNSSDAAGDDYAIQINVLGILDHRFHNADDHKSTAPPPEVVGWQNNHVALQSPAANYEPVGHWKNRTFLVRSHELFSEQRCEETATKLVDSIMRLKPFSLEEKHLELTGVDCNETKPLESSKELIAELNRYFRELRESTQKILEDRCFSAVGLKIVNLRADVDELQKLISSRDIHIRCVSEFCCGGPRYLRDFNVYWRRTAVLWVSEKSGGGGSAVGRCSICLEDLFGGFPSLIKLPCSHAYHYACIMRWFTNNQTCPYCRVTL